MADPELYFMRVDEPIELRKNVLETTRILIHTLQRYEQLKHTRQQKTMELQRLRGLMKEITQLCAELKHVLPSVDIKIPREPEEKKGKQKGKPVPAQKKDDELRSLEKELRLVEEKLARLDA